MEVGNRVKVVRNSLGYESPELQPGVTGEVIGLIDTRGVSVKLDSGFDDMFGTGWSFPNVDVEVIQ